MVSSGVVTGIREASISHMVPVPDGRKKLITPDLQVASQQSGPRTKEEVRAFQLTASELVASRLKEAGHNVRDVDVALEAAKSVRGIWPKSEFLAILRNPELFEKALQLFGEVEAFRAVA